VINSIHFEEGAPVKKGDRLARLDTRELEAQLAEARASFVLAEQNLERNEISVRRRRRLQARSGRRRGRSRPLKAAIDLLEVRSPNP
jgi:multidrug efflux pump subunit AcrA (membrane-fusion protein)